VPTVIALAAAAADSGAAELARRLGELGPVVLLAAAHAGLPEGVAFVKADLSSAEDAEASWRSAEERYGPLGVLVTLPAELPQEPVPVAAAGEELWLAALRDHLLVAANAARAAGRAMRDRGHGRLVMVTWRLDEAAGRVPHAAACGAVRQLASVLAAEVGEHGVTVNAIAVPPGRTADAVPAIRLLCSPDGGYLTSETLWPAAPDPAGVPRP
jgi:NAD(P)-dependent dehydrogenase (short-subunit alcohol dehydrogenase family)